MSVSLERLNTALAGRYLVEEQIGHGAAAAVYLAWDVKHERHVALKVLRAEVAADLGSERFLREIKLIARLQHPHILPLYDSGAAGKALYYVMPRVEGESLRERLARELQFPLDEAIRITVQVADALAYAHANDIVHRDIKPENIMLAGSATSSAVERTTDEMARVHAMLADFGIARSISRASGPSRRLTDPGLALGTPQYMSPEQAGGDVEIDGRSDIYSLACVLYEMLAGAPPYTGRTTQVVIARHFTQEVPSITRSRLNVPAQVEQALTRALAKSPNDRFATAKEFARALTAPGPGPIKRFIAAITPRAFTAVRPPVEKPK